MKRTTPSFVLELPLETTPIQENIILTRLAERQLYNAYLREVLKRLDLISVVQRVEKIPPEREGMNQTLSNCNTSPKKGIVQIP